MTLFPATMVDELGDTVIVGTAFTTTDTATFLVVAPVLSTVTFPLRPFVADDLDLTQTVVADTVLLPKLNGMEAE